MPTAAKQQPPLYSRAVSIKRSISCGVSTSMRASTTRHWVLTAPAAPHRSTEYATEHQPRYLPLPWCVECRVNIRHTFLCRNSTHTPRGQTFAALQKTPSKITEVAQRTRAPLAPLLQRSQRSQCAPAAAVPLPPLYAPPRPFHTPPPCPHRLTCHLSHLHYITPTALQQSQCRHLFFCYCYLYRLHMLTGFGNRKSSTSYVLMQNKSFTPSVGCSHCVSIIFTGL